MPIGYGIQDAEPIAPIPWTDAAEIARSPFGVALEAPCYDCTQYNWITGEEASSRRAIGFSSWNDGRINAVVARECYIGAKLGSSDSRITSSDLFNNRDACLWVARDAGNCRSFANHFYGSRIAIYNEGGDGYQSTSDRAEDSFIGTLCDARSKFIGTKFQQNLVRDVVFRGGNCELIDCEVLVQRETKEHNQFVVDGLPSFYGKAGIEVVGGGARIRGLQMFMTDWIHPANTPTDKPATGIIIGADDCEIRGEIYERDGLYATTVIRAVGQRRKLTIDCEVEATSDPSERLFVATDRCTELDITFRVNGLKKPVGQYIDLAAGWTGSVRIIDTATGKSQSLPAGRAV